MYEYKSVPNVQVGQLVRVPVRDRESVGVVWGHGVTERAKLREVREVYKMPPLSCAHRAFVEHVARHTVTPLGAVLKLSLKTPRVRSVIHLHMLEAKPVSAKQAKVLKAVARGRFESWAELARAANVSSSVVQGLARRGFLLKKAVFPKMSAKTFIGGQKTQVVLSKEQAQVAKKLCAAIHKGFLPFLLDGVTGSGKTEVYFEAVARAQKEGLSALILLPEIALTVPFLDRFAERFGFLPLVWHSQVSTKQKNDVWQAVLTSSPVVVGARSALFLPFTKLGLVVVDEEHEGSFRQEEQVLYHARDMAVLRASLEKCPIILSSATPSLESLVNVKRKGYRHLRLRARHGGGILRVKIIDLREMPKGFLSPPLRKALASRLESGEQSLLFLNRRGYAPLQVCRRCGYRLACPHCDAWLVEHRHTGRLLCHYCGYHCPVVRACVSCGAEGRFVPCGPGVERVEEEVKKLFLGARVEILSGDLPASQEEQRKVLEDMAAGRIDILVGTQIVAKGHNFPRLSLVGVVDADLGLDRGDLRAAERTYQVLHQVMGRAGRTGQKAVGLLQTHDPAHPVMEALVKGSKKAFLEAESAVRRAGGLPPFGALVAFIVSGPSWELVQEASQALYKRRPRVSSTIRILGPAPSAVARIKGRFRMRFLLKAPHRVDTQKLVRRWLGDIRLPRGTRVVVDVDPFNFL